MKHLFTLFLVGLLVLTGQVVLLTSAGLPQTTQGSGIAGQSYPLPGHPVTSTVDRTIPGYTYRIINSYPHDPQAFTQGLVYAGGFLYEGTGRYGRSTLRKVDPETGRVLQQLKLPDQVFGEGVTIFANRVIQLTWRSHLGFVYDLHSFKPLLEFSYPTEGWGLTHDGKHLIMSDGTSSLHLLHPETLRTIGQIEVQANNAPVPRLNELEYVRGEVYANIWRTDHIARIAPQTGQVLGWIDMQGLLGSENPSTPVGVLNGIAYDESNDRLFVTGKLWPTLFEIKLIPLKK
jgi:glutamine cyclotransferase